MARILIIEDSPTDTAVLTQLLERHGHEVLASSNAEDGIERGNRDAADRLRGGLFRIRAGHTGPPCGVLRISTFSPGFTATE